MPKTAQVDQSLQNSLAIKEAPLGTCNFGGVDYPPVPKSGIVIIRPLNPKKSPRVGVGPWIDMSRNVQMGYEKDRIQVNREMTLNLSNELDRKRYAHIRIHPYIVGIGAKRKIVVINREVDAVNDNKKYDYILDCMNLISKMSTNDLQNLAEMIPGIVVNDDTSMDIIKSHINRRVTEHPKADKKEVNTNPGVLDILNDIDYPIKVLLRRLIKGKFIFLQDNSYKFTPELSGIGTVIGVNELQVLGWIKQDPQRLINLHALIDGKNISFEDEDKD